MIRRPPRSTPLYSSAASDVYKRQFVGKALLECAVSGDAGQRIREPGIILRVLAPTFSATGVQGSKQQKNGSRKQQPWCCRSNDGHFPSLLFPLLPGRISTSWEYVLLATLGGDGPGDSEGVLAQYQE